MQLNNGERDIFNAMKASGVRPMAAARIAVLLGALMKTSLTKAQAEEVALLLQVEPDKIVRSNSPEEPEEKVGKS